MQRLGEICSGVAATYGAEVKLEYEREAPAVVNNDVARQGPLPPWIALYITLCAMLRVSPVSYLLCGSVLH